MNTVAMTVATANARELAAVIIGVLAFTAIFAWVILRYVRSIEDPRKVRRRIFVLALLYVFAVINGIVEFAKGKEPALALVGLPIGLFFAWSCLRAASKIQVPPK